MVDGRRVLIDDWTLYYNRRPSIVIPPSSVLSTPTASRVGRPDTVLPSLRSESRHMVLYQVRVGFLNVTPSLFFYTFFVRPWWFLHDTFPTRTGNYSTLVTCECVPWSVVQPHSRTSGYLSHRVLCYGRDCQNCDVSVYGSPDRTLVSQFPEKFPGGGL